ncbi:hypothetical protein GCM10010303_67480 [Streptomyces purpurascens]|nr:hypothetical protein GCM10010303_67480 [Streptomyces purpurascens]
MPSGATLAFSVRGTGAGAAVAGSAAAVPSVTARANPSATDVALLMLVMCCSPCVPASPWTLLPRPRAEGFPRANIITRQRVNPPN